MNEISLLKVKYLPKELEAGVLYYSKKYGIAGHLCPCGCGNKIMTPLGPSEWSITIKKGKASLYPSIGNWQLPCKSHYWINKGEIEWSYQWTQEEIEQGQQYEEKKRLEYYKRRNNQKSLFKRISNWFLGM